MGSELISGVPFEVLEDKVGPLEPVCLAPEQVPGVTTFEILLNGVV